MREGAATAENFGELVSSLVIPRPLPNLEAVLPIGWRLEQLTQQGGYSRLSHQAVGLLETRGFPAMVGAADAMLKAADVQLASYERIGAGLCTVIIRGSVSNVAVAVEAGMYEAERIGELNAVMVIPRPLDDLEQTLPLASCWIEQQQPLKLPIAVKEKQEELLPVTIKEKEKQEELMQLPDLANLPAPLKEEL